MVVFLVRTPRGIVGFSFFFFLLSFYLRVFIVHSNESTNLMWGVVFTGTLDCYYFYLYQYYLFIYSLILYFFCLTSRMRVLIHTYMMVWSPQSPSYYIYSGSDNEYFSACFFFVLFSPWSLPWPKKKNPKKSRQCVVYRCCENIE
jgi:hypothetical protein